MVPNETKETLKSRHQKDPNLNKFDKIKLETRVVVDVLEKLTVVTVVCSLPPTNNAKGKPCHKERESENTTRRKAKQLCRTQEKEP